MSNEFPYKKGDRLKLTREIIVEDPNPTHSGYILAKIEGHQWVASVPLVGATFEKVVPNGLEQFLALPIGAQFTVTWTETGRTDTNIRVKVDTNRFYNQQAGSTFDVTFYGDTALGDAPYNYTIKEVKK